MNALEAVTEAAVMLYVADTDPRAALTVPTNVGGDTDCIVGCLGGVVGAFACTGGIPAGWLAKTQAAIGKNTLTVQRWSVAEVARNLVQAVRKKAAAIRLRPGKIDALKPLNAPTVHAVVDYRVGCSLIGPSSFLPTRGHCIRSLASANETAFSCFGYNW
jgi:hypothetical protein